MRGFPNQYAVHDDFAAGGYVFGDEFLFGGNVRGQNAVFSEKADALVLAQIAECHEDVVSGVELQNPAMGCGVG